MKKIFFVALFALFFIASPTSVFSQPKSGNITDENNATGPAGPPGDGALGGGISPQDAAPIDGGIAALIIGAAAFGIRRIQKNN